MEVETRELRWYVYVDWTMESTPRAFYVGKGVRTRVLNFESRNAFHAQISAEFGSQRTVLAGPMTEEDAFLGEVRQIRELGTYRHAKGRPGWGANLTPGGRGKRPRRVHHTGLVGRQIGMHYKRRGMLRRLGLLPAGPGARS